MTFENFSDSKKNLEYFNDKFVTGRMQTDEFCAELLYLNTVAEKWTDGVSQGKLTNWYKTAIERGYQNESSKKWIGDYKKLKKILDDLFNILHETPNKYKKKHSRMICLVMALYYQELLEKYGKIDHHDFVCMFFKVYKKWSSTNAQVYHGNWEWKRVLREFGYDNLLEAAKPSHSYYRYTLDRFMDSDEFNELNKNTRNILKRFKQILSGYQAFPVTASWYTEDRDLGPFFNLFGGKNKNALTTIRQILEYERMMGSNEEWGISKRDPIRNFTDVQKDIIYERQSGKDFYDGKPLDRADAIADHDIPWSWGTERGGITTLENCVITSSAHNKAKGNMSGSQYKRDILLNPNATEDYFSR